MLNNFFLISEQAKFLNENISGKIINEIYSSEKSKLTIELSNGSGIYTLEFSAVKNLNYLVSKKNFFKKPKKNYAGILPETYGHRILKTDIFNNDRIICFELSGGLKIFFTFFSDKANAFVTNEELIINSFKNSVEYKNKSSDIIFAKKTTGNPVNENLTARKFLKITYPAFGELYYKEALHNAFIDETAIADEMTSEKLKNEIEKIAEKLAEPKFYLYSGSGKNNLSISLIKLESLKNLELTNFEDSNKLINEFVKLKFKTDTVNAIKEKKQNEFTKRISHIRSKLTGLQRQLKESEDSQKFRIYGDAILQNINKFKKGDNKFIFENLDGERIEIPLKENISPAENAQRYFERYKNQKNSVAILKKKIIKLETEMKTVLKESEEFETKTELKALMKEGKKHEQNKSDETSAFRKFALSDKYEVWVGKNSASNDLLTTKYSSPNDLWFHVRGAGGSHTVLKAYAKKDQPGKEIIVKAASIAAYYSKARNASSVPVAYCERKFVKKKKGMKEGSVIMEREKVIFVKPLLPEPD